MNSKNYDDIAILATIATYMRRDLHQNQGFYENILPRYRYAYTIDEFKSHSRMISGTIEALCREVQATGRAAQRHALETAAVKG